MSGIEVDVLLNEINIAYQRLKNSEYPDYLDSLWSRRDRTPHGKDNSKAAEHRNRGNVEFACCDYKQASVWYTNSVAWATKNSEELALAYANRSAALFRLGEYVPCLLDINRALKSDQYPERLRDKLRDRKKMSLLEIARMGVKIANICNETDPIDSTATNNQSNVPKDQFDNPLLPNTTSKIKLAFDEKWGRHLIATEDIEPGEILSCERFFVRFMYADLQRTHCSYCWVRCEALIPCPSCSQVMYCSENCFNRALNIYHRSECRMWPLINDESSRANDLWRALTICFVGTEQGTKLGQLTASLSIRDIFKENVNPAAVNKPYASDYLSILQLRRTFDQPSKESILLAVKAVIWLQRFSFFENHPDPNFMSEMEIFTTLALLNHLQSLTRYNFYIGEATNPVGNLPYVIGSKAFNIGYGLIALHTLVSHSCDPNVECVTTREGEQIIFSVRPIKCGEQIFTSYCDSFSKESLVNRMEKLLSVYGFECRCEACTNDWPSYHTIIYRKPDEFFIEGSLSIHFSGAPVNRISIAQTWILTMEIERLKLQTTRNSSVKELTMEIKTMLLEILRSSSVEDTNFEKIVRCRKLIHDHVRSPSVFSVVCEDILVMYMMWTYNKLRYLSDDAAIVEEVRHLGGGEEQMFLKKYGNLI